MLYGTYIKKKSKCLLRSYRSSHKVMSGVHLQKKKIYIYIHLILSLPLPDTAHFFISFQVEDTSISPDVVNVPNCSCTIYDGQTGANLCQSLTVAPRIHPMSTLARAVWVFFRSLGVYYNIPTYLYNIYVFLALLLYRTCSCSYLRLSKMLFFFSRASFGNLHPPCL